MKILSYEVKFIYSVFGTHHANHYERTCPEFINSFTALLTPPELPKREKMNEKEEEEEEEDQDEEEEE